MKMKDAMTQQKQQRLMMFMGSAVFGLLLFLLVFPANASDKKLPKPSLTPPSYPLQFVIVKQGLMMMPQNITEVKVVPGQKAGCYGVQWALDKASTTQLRDLTRNNLHGLMMVMINGQMVDVAPIQQPLGEKTQLPACYSKVQAEKIVAALQAKNHRAKKT